MELPVSLVEVLYLDGYFISVVLVPFRQLPNLHSRQAKWCSFAKPLQIHMYFEEHRIASTCHALTVDTREPCCPPMTLLIS